MQNGAPDLSTISGPQLHVKSVIKGLEKLGHHIRTVAFQRGKLQWSDDLQNWSPPEFGFSHAKWFRLAESSIRRIQYETRSPFIGIFNSLHYADACYQLLNGYDLLYERYGYMGYGGVIAARRIGIPIVIELNGNIVKEIDEMGVKMSPTQRRMGRWITYRTLYAADHVIVVSEALKNILIADFGLHPEKVTSVVNGTDITLFSQSFDETLIRNQYNLTSKPIIIFVGNFQPWHGVNLLITSFRKVHTRFPAAQLVIIGDGEGRDELITQIRDLEIEDNVRLLGRLPQDQVAAVISLADIAVAPYPFERGDIVGTPLKLIEYMAASKAIVASTAPIHEIITEGKTGLRVKPADPEALAQGICCLLDDERLRLQLGANAGSQAQYYSWENVVQKLTELFHDQLAI